MRIRTLNIHHYAPGDTSPAARAVENNAYSGAPIKTHAPQSSQIQCDTYQRRHGAQRCSPRSPSLRWCGWRAIVIIVVSVVASLLPWSLALPTMNFESITFRQWAALFESASASMQLSQLYLSAPRVRTKILVATSVTMAELLSGEAIFRHRISEIVNVAVERVVVEYIETTALQESARGSWTLSLGISALVAPPTVSLISNETLVMSTVDTERQRILDRLLFGGVVRGGNVTISDLQLFGASMRLLSANLDGETFYQIDTTSWVGVRLVLASSDATATASSASSSGAFQDLRLRFLLARFLQRLKIDTSSILVRDTIMLEATEPYGVPAILLPIEIHVGESASLRSAVAAYLRNISLSTALRDMEPVWSLLAVETDEDADVLQGNGSPYRNESTTRWTAPWQVAIAIRVDGLSIEHVQRRGPAILDATRTLLARVVNVPTIALSFGPVTAVPVHQATSEVTEEAASRRSVLGSGFVSSSGGDDMDNIVIPPMDRGFVVQIHITPVSETVIWISETNNAIGSALSNATDQRAALGILDPFELSSNMYTKSRVQYLQTTTLQGDEDSLDIGSSFVRIALTLKPRANATTAAMDVFAVYRIRCALLLVLERVFVSDEDLIHAETAPVLDVAVRVEYIAQVTDETQRSGIKRAVQSIRLRQAIDVGGLFMLVSSTVDLYAYSPIPRSIGLPGTTSRLIADPPSPASEVFLAPMGTVFDFADPWPAQNPSVLTNVPPSCSSPSPIASSSFYGCLVLHWSSEFPVRSVFVRSVSVTSGVVVSSTNIRLPLPTQRAAQPNSNAGVDAPWVPAMASGEEPHDWALQFLSTSVQNVTVNLTLAFAGVSIRFYPAVKLSIGLRLADTQTPLSKMQVASLRRLPVTLVPLTSGSAPETIVQRVSSLFATGSRSDMTSISTANVSIGLSQQSWLGLVDSTSAIAAWTAYQPACLACLPSIDACKQLDECVTITQCFQRVVDHRMILYSELLQQSNASFDLTDELRFCLSSPNPWAVQWSSRGRRAFLSSVQCVLQSSCAMATSPSLGRRLSLRYTPRQQVIRVVPSHFPMSLSFLLDINGDTDAPANGVTRTRSSESLLEVTQTTLAALRALVLDLYGDLARGLNVTTTVSTVDALEIRIQYLFLDAGVVGLPFVSVVTESTADPAPFVETTSTESLGFVTETI